MRVVNCELNYIYGGGVPPPDEPPSFTTRRQKYEFNYLPFGIQSGPSYMCRLMDAALQGLAWDVCMPYLDDVAVWATGEGETLADRELASFEQMLGTARRSCWSA